MNYGSVCSGIEAASAAWEPMGWRPSFFAEIEKFPSAVLAHRYPSVPNLGDFTQIQRGDFAADIDVLVGGTPCQSFSVAGLRKGLADDRGNLALEYLRLADRLRPKWLVWENVPGVLSSAGGRDFGSILGGMVELGYGFAYRVLDAQYIRVDGYARAVPQRRRRVFLVGHIGDWRRAAAVLFERESLQGNSAPRREAGEGSAPTLSARTKGGGGLGTDFDLDGGLVANSLLAKANSSHAADMDTYVAHALRADGFDASEDGTGRGTPLVPVADTLEAAAGRSRGAGTAPGVCIPIPFDTTQITSPTCRSNPQPGDPSHTLSKGAHPPAIAFDSKASGRNGFGVGEISPTLRAMGHKNSHTNAGGQVAVQEGWRVRRLTPKECERLQGFPDGYTHIPYRGKEAADGPRYKALGNSMAVNCMRWIGRRIDLVEAQ